MEPCEEDIWNRRLPVEPDTVVVDDTEQYEIEHILRQEADNCLVQWKGLSNPT